MALLNQYLSSGSPVAHKEDAAHLAEIFRHYLATFPEKKKLILELKSGKATMAEIVKLRLLLRSELIDTEKEEKTEIQLIKELEQVQHEMEIRKIQVLNYRFNTEETIELYVHELLKKLAAILILEMHITQNLQKGAKQPGTLIENLNNQLDLEERIIGQIQRSEQSFLQIFVELMLGERVIDRLYQKQKRVFTLSKVLSEKLQSGLTYDLAMAIFTETQARIQQLVSAGDLESHKDVDFEFVNSPAFIEIVREKMRAIRGRMPSEQLIDSFVHIFREWYTYRDFLDI